MAVKQVKVVINEQEHILTWSEEHQAYESTLTAPNKSSWNENVGHYYAVAVTATDDAGNETTITDTDGTFGSKLKLLVKEKNAPTIEIVYPTASSAIGNASPVIQWEVKDDDSGVNPETISIQIDGQPAVTEGIQKSPIEGGYECSYTASSLSDGAHSFTVNVRDFDNNAASPVTTSFKVDTVPPVLTIDTPSDNLITNKPTVTVSGRTNDATSSPVTLTVNDVPVEVQEDGQFTYEFTLSSGNNVITVVATDSVGKSTTVVRNVTLDTGAPVFQEVTITPNPVDAGATYLISVKVVDE